MKIAIVGLYPRDNQVKGGVEGVVHVLANRLASGGDDDVYVISPGAGSAITCEQKDGLTIYRLPRPVLPGFLNYWTVERRAIHKLLKAIKPDIAHFHDSAGWLIGYDGVQLFTVHGIAEKDTLFSSRKFKKLRSGIMQLIENIGRRKVNDIVLISPYVKEELNLSPKANLHSIENPIDPVFFCQPNCLTSRINRLGHVVSAGKVSERKNTLGLLRAFKKAKMLNQSLSLSIAGSLEDVEYVNNCYEYVKKNGMEGSVQFLGNLGRPQLAELYRSAAVFVIVSQQETAPMVIAEAMACGAPVIGSNVCGIPYMIKKGVTGLLVDPDDTSSIAAAIEDVSTSTNYKPEAILESAHRRFHPENIVMQTYNLYTRVIASSEKLC